MDGKMTAVCTNHAPEGAYTLVFGYILIQREQHYSLQETKFHRMVIVVLLVSKNNYFYSLEGVWWVKWPQAWMNAVGLYVSPAG
jgi:hypothetical protein